MALSSPSFAAERRLNRVVLLPLRSFVFFFFILVLCHKTQAFHVRVTSARRTPASSLRAHLTPMGGLCPFVSSTRSERMSHYEDSIDVSNSNAIAVLRIQEEIETILDTLENDEGNNLDVSRLLFTADRAQAVAEDWRDMTHRLSNSTDFQMLEDYFLSEARLEATADGSHARMIALLEWEQAFLRAIANKECPPPFPNDIDISAVMEHCGAENPTMDAAVACMDNRITAMPFNLDAMAHPSLRDECHKLVQDHAALIDCGGTYASFAPTEKLAFLEEMEGIRERWDILFLRFQLMDAINPEFRRQCDEYLQRNNLNEELYWKHYRTAHDKMRHQARAELDGLAP